MQTFAVELSNCDKCSIAGKPNAWVLCGSVRETSYFTLTALKIVKINLHHRWALSWRIIYLYLLERSEDDAVRKCAVVCWMRLLTTFSVYMLYWNSWITIPPSTHRSVVDEDQLSFKHCTCILLNWPAEGDSWLWKDLWSVQEAAPSLMVVIKRVRDED